MVQAPREGRKRHDVPAHHRAAAALDAYVEAGDLEEPTAVLAGARGYRFLATQGGETAFGGSEAVVVMTLDPEGRRFRYILLATREMNEAPPEYSFAGMTVFDTRSLPAWTGASRPCVPPPRDASETAGTIILRMAGNILK